MLDQLILKVLFQISMFSLGGVTFYRLLLKKLSNKNVTWLQGLQWGVTTGILYSLIMYFLNR